MPIISDTIDEPKEVQFELSMLAMVSLGVGEIFGAVGMGYIVDHIGAKRSSILNMVMIAIAAFSVIVFLWMETYSWFAFLMTFLWGL